MPQSLSKIYVHLIFSTKERRGYLMNDIRADRHAYLATVLKNINCHTVLINSVEDHVHLLFELHRTVTIAKAVEEVKKSSSKWLKTQHRDLEFFSWQAGYGAFSVSESNVPVVANYIRKQEEHHKVKTFKEEFQEFLDKHGIEYDEQYVWD